MRGAIGARADAQLAAIGVHVDVPFVVIDGMSLKTGAGGVCERPGRLGRVVRRLEYDDAFARIVMQRGIRISRTVP